LLLHRERERESVQGRFERKVEVKKGRKEKVQRESDVRGDRERKVT